MNLIGTVSAQYQLIDKLVRSAKGETRRGLLRVGAAYAALVGWLYQDAGDMDGAAFWRGVTQEIAMRSRDPHLIGYSLVNQAQVRTDLGDGHAVVDLCEAALDDADQLVPKVRIMAMQQQAHGASLTGERRMVDQLIDQAGRLLPCVDDDLPWGNACRRTPATSKYSGPPVTDGSASAQRRVPCGCRSSLSSRRPLAAATAWEPDQAVEIARTVAMIAVETRSARMRRELVTLERAMRPWQDAPVGRDLAEILEPVTERG